jgi:hypothetical protein
MVSLPQEQHRNEQYFFDEATRDWLKVLLHHYTFPCLIGVPTVARVLVRYTTGTVLLDIDERFADVPGFKKWNLYRPEPVGDFDVLVCDPPFKTVTFSQLFNALRVLANGDFSQPIMITGLASREADLLATFHPFKLRPTGIQARYVSVQDQDGRNKIMFYANFRVPWHHRPAHHYSVE